MEISDNQLVGQVLNGETRLYSILVDRYKGQVYNLMYRFSGSADEAADMTQEVFCRVFEKLASYSEKTSFFSWLYTLALNYARDWERKRRKRSIKLEWFAKEVAPEPPDIHLDLEKKENESQLQQALAQLPAEKRELMILRFTHDCSIRELAEIFRLSESGVKMRLKRSLAELQRIMSDS